MGSDGTSGHLASATLCWVPTLLFLRHPFKKRYIVLSVYTGPSTREKRAGTSAAAASGSSDPRRRTLFAPVLPQCRRAAGHSCLLLRSEPVLSRRSCLIVDLLAREWSVRLGQPSVCDGILPVRVCDGDCLIEF